jgi:Glycosyltransferase family 87
MRARAREIALWTAAALMSLWVISHSSPGDYREDAAPAVDALAHGRLGEFFDAQPLMGSVSILFRAPFVAAHDALGVPWLSPYEVGVAVCVAVSAVFGVLVARGMLRRDRSGWAAGAVLAICVANPMAVVAVEYGHPEEILGGVLCAAAVLLAAQRRPVLAGILLGLAVATKQWAVLAIIPALLAAPVGRWRIAAIGGALAASLTLPFLLAGPDEFVASHRALAEGIPLKGAVNVWWPFSSVTTRSVFDGVEWVSHEIHHGPALAGAAHQIIVLLALPLGAVHWLRRRKLQPIDALGLLAVLLLLRCILDPVNNGYYHVPFLLALVTYEAVRRRGELPVLSLIATSMLWITFDRLLPEYHAGALVNAFYLAWTVPLCIALLLWQLRVPLPRRRRAGSGAASRQTAQELGLAEART